MAWNSSITMKIEAQKAFITYSKLFKQSHPRFTYGGWKNWWNNFIQQRRITTCGSITSNVKSLNASWFLKPTSKFQRSATFVRDCNYRNVTPNEMNNYSEGPKHVLLIRTILCEHEAEVWTKPKNKLRTIWASDFKKLPRNHTDFKPILSLS